MPEYRHTIEAEEHARIARFLRWFALGAVLFILLIVLLFVTADRWLRLISIESERRFIEPYIELLLETKWFESDPELQSYVSRLAREINDDLDNNWDEDFELRVYVIASDMVNAVATLGGYIFVFEGLIESLDNENSLAMVLGHEIAHMHHRDPLLGTGRGILLQLAMSSLSGNSIDLEPVHLSGDIILNSYSREQEFAADELALSLVRERYGHVGGATGLFDVLAEDSPEGEVTQFLSTHPATAARIERIKVLATEQGWLERAPAPYPDAVQSVLGN